MPLNQVSSLEEIKQEELARQRRVLLLHRIIENEPSFFIRMKIRIRLLCMYILNRE
jgi:hypothetical protein